MAKGKFVPNRKGYIEIMNSDNEIWDECEWRAARLAAAATRISGIDYFIDTRRGLHRLHTRVSTEGTTDFFRERHHRALAAAVSAAGGHAAGERGYKSLAKAMAPKKSKKKR